MSHDSTPQEVTLRETSSIGIRYARDKRPRFCLMLLTSPNIVEILAFDIAFVYGRTCTHLHGAFARPKQRPPSLYSGNRDSPHPNSGASCRASHLSHSDPSILALQAEILLKVWHFHQPAVLYQDPTGRCRATGKGVSRAHAHLQPIPNYSTGGNFTSTCATTTDSELRWRQQ